MTTTQNLWAAASNTELISAAQWVYLAQWSCRQQKPVSALLDALTFELRLSDGLPTGDLIGTLPCGFYGLLDVEGRGHT